MQKVTIYLVFWLQTIHRHVVRKGTYILYFFSDRVFEICTKQLFSLLITLTRIKIYNGWFTNIYKHVIIICAYTFIFREHCRHDRVIYSSREACNLVWCVFLWSLLFLLSQLRTVTSYMYLTFGLRFSKELTTYDQINEHLLITN